MHTSRRVPMHARARAWVYGPCAALCAYPARGVRAEQHTHVSPAVSHSWPRDIHRALNRRRCERARAALDPQAPMSSHRFCHTLLQSLRRHTLPSLLAMPTPHLPYKQMACGIVCLPAHTACGWRALTEHPPCQARTHTHRCALACTCSA